MKRLYNVYVYQHHVNQGSGRKQVFVEGVAQVTAIRIYNRLRMRFNIWNQVVIEQYEGSQLFNLINCHHCYSVYEKSRSMPFLTRLSLNEARKVQKGLRKFRGIESVIRHQKPGVSRRFTERIWWNKPIRTM